MRRVSLAFLLISVLGVLACSDAGSLTGPSPETLSGASLSAQDLPLNTGGGTSTRMRQGGTPASDN